MRAINPEWLRNGPASIVGWVRTEGDYRMGVTTVASLREFTDFREWEYADSWHGNWRRIEVVSARFAASDDFPIVVRRRQTEDDR